MFFKETKLKFLINIQDLALDIENFINPKLEVNYNGINQGINNDIENKLKELNELLKLNENTNYSYINAAVVSRNVNSYFSKVKIDKGKTDGIDTDMAVVTNKGMIGFISQISENYSTVELLNSKNISKKIAVSITDGINIYNANVSDFDYDKNLLIVTSIRSNSKIKKGDEVITNGLGKTIPGGLKIGIVENVEMEDDTASKKIKVKLNNDIDNIRYVGVVKVKKQ